jgi:RNA polymerase sporulation-specific sigma factor
MVVRVMTRRLSLDETKNCLRAWRELADEEALEVLTICNGGLVGFFAKKYLGKGLTFEELQSAGNEGLINAINKFDYNERAIEGFSSYISVAIENQIRIELKKYNKHSHVLSFDQPIGQNKDGDELKIEDLIGTDAEQLIEDVISEMKIDIVREALQCLTSRERQIILLRYGLDDTHKKTQDEIAEIFGCSKSLIAKQEKKALIKMRHPRNTKKLKDFIEE